MYLLASSFLSKNYTLCSALPSKNISFPIRTILIVNTPQQQSSVSKTVITWIMYPLRKIRQKNVIEFFTILYFCPVRFLLLSLNVTFILVSILRFHFVMVSDQNTSCNILLKIIYLSVTSHVMLFVSLPSSLCPETRECWVTS